MDINLNNKNRYFGKDLSNNNNVYFQHVPKHEIQLQNYQNIVKDHIKNNCSFVQVIGNQQMLSNLSSLPTQQSFYFNQLPNYNNDQSLSNQSVRQSFQNNSNFSQIQQSQLQNSCQMTQNQLQYCLPVISDIFTFLKQKEDISIVNHNYFTIQKDINEIMRAVLIDWLVTVHEQLKFQEKTLFLSILLIDKYLEKTILESRNLLQLVGITALYIATKYEEYYPPAIQDFIFLTENIYTQEEVMDMEARILNTISYNINLVTPIQFLDYFSLAAQLDIEGINFCTFVIELSFMDITFVQYRPSLLLAAAIYLYNKIKHANIAWSQDLKIVTGYEEISVRPCAKELCRIWVQPILQKEYQSVINKFKKAEYSYVADIKFIE